MPSNDLARSRQCLGKLSHLLRRLLDCEAAWVMHLSGWDDKIALSQAMCHTARAAKAVQERLPALGRADVIARASSQASEEVIDGWCRRDDESAVRAAVATGSHAVRALANRLLAQTDMLADQPTARALHDVELALTDKARLLAADRWPVDADLRFDLSDAFDVPNGSQTARPALLDEPRRPAGLTWHRTPALDADTVELVRTHEGQRQLWHFIYADIEVCAAEVCARNIAQFGAEMPFAFSLDMARQCSDEARHALIAQRHMAELDVALGDYTYCNAVWLNANKGRTLAQRLAIEQVIAEGNGLDEAARTLGAMRDAGLTLMAHDYEFLTADETTHAGHGIRWIRWLCDDDETRFRQVIEEAACILGRPLRPRAPWVPHLREAAGFPSWYMAFLTPPKGVTPAYPCAERLDERR